MFGCTTLSGCNHIHAEFMQVDSMSLTKSESAGSAVAVSDRQVNLVSALEFAKQALDAEDTGLADYVGNKHDCGNTRHAAYRVSDVTLFE